ncbi:DUF2505 family protein [Quisquiliibacterium transsilvanicum]|nr:DUF2505 family protein [Quisquiliibacterium transsilvanicum]
MSEAPADDRFRVTQSYPAGIGQLWAVLGTRDYVEHKYRALGSRALRILRFDADETRIEVELERSAPVAAEGLPRWAGVVAGRWQTMRHRSRWQRVDVARVDAWLDIRMAALPVFATGVGRLVERSPASSRLTLEFQAGCGLPVVGREVARLFAGQVQRGLAEDFAFTVDHLEASRGRSQGQGDQANPMPR